MKYILFLMFFTAQPTADPKNELWMLQSTSTMEFTSRAGCDQSVARLIDAVKETATIKLFGWCFANDTGSAKIMEMQKDVEKLNPDKKVPPNFDYYSGPPKSSARQFLQQPR